MFLALACQKKSRRAVSFDRLTAHLTGDYVFKVWGLENFQFFGSLSNVGMCA